MHLKVFQKHPIITKDNLLNKNKKSILQFQRKNSFKVRVVFHKKTIRAFQEIGLKFDKGLNS